MADCDSQCVGGILGENLAQPQDCLHHDLDLLFLGPPVAYDGLLDLERRVFMDRKPAS